MTDNGGQKSSDNCDDEAKCRLTRTRFGFQLVLVGFVVVLGAFAIAVARWEAAADVAAAMAPITAVVGSLVGAFFGVQAGSEGKEAVERKRDEEADRARLFAAALNPPEALRLLGYGPSDSDRPRP